MVQCKAATEVPHTLYPVLLFLFRETYASAAASSLNNFCSVKHVSGCLCSLGQGCFLFLCPVSLFRKCLVFTSVHTNSVPGHLWLVFACLCLYSRVQSGTWRWKTRKLSYLSMGSLPGWAVFLPSYCSHILPLLVPSMLAAVIAVLAPLLKWHW